MPPSAYSPPPQPMTTSYGLPFPNPPAFPATIWQRSSSHIFQSTGEVTSQEFRPILTPFCPNLCATVSIHVTLFPVKMKSLCSHRTKGKAPMAAHSLPAFSAPYSMPAFLVLAQGLPAWMPPRGTQAFPQRGLPGPPFSSLAPVPAHAVSLPQPPSHLAPSHLTALH